MPTLRQNPLNGDEPDEPRKLQMSERQANKPAKRKLHPALEANMWKPGQSGNPKGPPNRHPALATRVREAIGNDPTELVSVLIDIALDTREKSADRIMAVDKLLDRGYGKAPAHAPVEGGDPLGHNELDQAIRSIADQLVKQAHPTLQPEIVRQTTDGGEQEPHMP